jgi:TatA/E family protein of Tat protein translocase
VFRNPIIDAVVVLVVVLLIFGPKRLPLLGKGMREFRDSITSGEDAEAPALPPPAAQVAAPSAAKPEPAALDSTVTRP